MQIKSSSKLKLLLKKKDQLKKAQTKTIDKNDLFGDKINDLEWIERAQQREMAKKKKMKLLS
jgi:hypothetical protein